MKMYELAGAWGLWLVLALVSTYDTPPLGILLFCSPLSWLLCGVLMQAYFSGIDNW